MKTRVLLCGIFLSSPVAVQALPAFYGAEGGGALSVGGRGGAVCQVTNLDNSGPGSLRACVDMSGPRTVVFRVGGTINLTSTLMIRNPYITIAGHTAPGGGIQLRVIDPPGRCDSVLRVTNHNVIVRYLTLRKGVCDPRQPGVPDGLGINYTTHSSNYPNNIMIDHLSVFWAHDETMDAWGWTQPTITLAQVPYKITFQNNILAEPLRGHSVGLLTGSNDRDVAEAMVDIDVIRNLFAHSSHRNPLMKTRRSRVTNNIVYNWSLYATQLGAGMHGDVINNLYKHPAPNSTNSSRRSEIQVFLYDPTICPGGSGEYIRKDPSIYAAGNQGPIYGTDNWDMVKRVTCENGTIIETLPAQYRRSSPLAPVGAPITVIPTQELESTLYPIVGDSRRLDCMGNWVFKRDSQDARIVSHAQTNHNPNFVAGHSNWGIWDENEVGGFPTIAGGTPCQDTDGDGMPDEWEDAMGLNKNDPSDRNTLHPSGYTMLEMYLNGPMTTNTTLTTPANVRFVQ